MSTESCRGKKGVFTATVLSNQLIRNDYYRLNLELEPSAFCAWSNVMPGQFVELDLTRISLPPESKIPPHLRDKSERQIILRRPFSFSDVIVSPIADNRSVKVEITYCVCGPATVRMMSLSKGNELSVMGPLGNGFKIPQGKTTALLLAGGMGAPPIIHLAAYLKQHTQMNVVAFAGARSCEHLPFTVKIGNIKGLSLEEFEQLGVDSFVATDDGSAGFSGFVTNCAREWIEKNPIDPTQTIIYSCGPELMLNSVAHLAHDYSMDCQLSMERMMACGIGLCQSCAVETKVGQENGTEKTQYKLCCKDGPVFDSKEIVLKLSKNPYDGKEN